MGVCVERDKLLGLVGNEDGTKLSNPDCELWDYRENNNEGYMYWACIKCKPGLFVNLNNNLDVVEENPCVSSCSSKHHKVHYLFFKYDNKLNKYFGPNCYENSDVV